ncbi:MAG: hypothetical protein EXS31_12075 [Pedosphaera sp.]|nr:hypothetical protein [Pedosphaera sp.]
MQNLVLAVILPGALLAPSDSLLGGSSSTGSRAEAAYTSTRERYRADEKSPEKAWQFSRACFDKAEMVDTSAKRESLAKEGIDAARRCLQNLPRSSEGHYYLAMNLGQLARTKSVGALKLVIEMEREFKSAIEFDEKIDHGGPRRTLGILYRDAPGWPASIGSRSKARQELERAAQLFPNFPENRLTLAESYASWGEHKHLLAEVESIKSVIPAARQEWKGELWTSSWADWDERWEKLLKRLESGAAKKPRA